MSSEMGQLLEEVLAAFESDFILEGEAAASDVRYCHVLYRSCMPNY